MTIDISMLLDIGTPAHTLIQSELRKLARRHEIRILYACESGSRAWGIASSDSDYDVRFIYIKRQGVYLSAWASERREVIDRVDEPRDDCLDMVGWDITKALRLFAKPNPAMYEWFRSPIVYFREDEFYDQLVKLSPMYWHRYTAMFHYRNLAQNQFDSYLKGREDVVLKKYLYVLRPLMAYEWFRAGRGIPPIDFEDLVNRTLMPTWYYPSISTPYWATQLKTAVLDLLDAKRRGPELGVGPKIEIIHRYVEMSLNYYSGDRLGWLPQRRGSVRALDTLFQDTLERVWSD